LVLFNGCSRFGIRPLLLPLITKRQEQEGVATVEFNQKVVVVLEWLVEWFGGVSNKVEKKLEKAR
jgi:hypothetical protein